MIIVKIDGIFRDLINRDRATFQTTDASIFQTIVQWES